MTINVFQSEAYRSSPLYATVPDMSPKANSGKKFKLKQAIIAGKIFEYSQTLNLVIEFITYFLNVNANATRLWDSNPRLWN